jgi:hypothetical protein
MTGSYGGVSPYTYSTDNGNTFQASPLFEGLTHATYQCVVKDADDDESDAVAYVIQAGA